mmetsp:Transcript_6435/g.15474  ORF Transcript_6435/g.15474 Transcript_6435/m.15474 type:complete len:411 (-) Transcript_6435:372-1604(-)
MSPGSASTPAARAAARVGSSVPPKELRSRSHMEKTRGPAGWADCPGCAGCPSAAGSRAASDSFRLRKRATTNDSGSRCVRPASSTAEIGAPACAPPTDSHGAPAASSARTSAVMSWPAWPKRPTRVAEEPREPVEKSRAPRAMERAGRALASETDRSRLLDTPSRAQTATRAPASATPSESGERGTPESGARRLTPSGTHAPPPPARLVCSCAPRRSLFVPKIFSHCDSTSPAGLPSNVASAIWSASPAYAARPGMLAKEVAIPPVMGRRPQLATTSMVASPERANPTHPDVSTLPLANTSGSSWESAHSAVSPTLGAVGKTASSTRSICADLKSGVASSTKLGGAGARASSATFVKSGSVGASIAKGCTTVSGSQPAVIETASDPPIVSVSAPEPSASPRGAREACTSE